MHISRVRIKNFKCFKEPFDINLNEGLNILVGDNEAGKSTILEAIHLVLSGLSGGRYLRNELSEYLFNKTAVDEFKQTLKNPPEILIEIFFSGEGLAEFEGDDNSEKKRHCGAYLKIAPDERERLLFDSYIGLGNVTAIPIEYYEATWSTFAREPISPKHLPIKSAFIDSTGGKYQNGSDIYISHIIKNHLDTNHKNSLSQAHRKLQANFMDDASVRDVNEIIKGISKKLPNDKEVSLSIDLSTRNAWENGMVSYVENIPFQHIGKGQQSIIKTKLALAHKKAEEANFILIEEPENHLSHTKLNQLIKDIDDKCKDGSKQILISTHNSFVANKLGLDRIILLNEKRQIRLEDLTYGTINFFKKVAGYDTLRLILCEAAILCEGDSDELIVQKAYRQKHNKLPIEDGIEVMSVGLSFDRYIEIAKKIGKKVSVVTDNDGKPDTLKEKFIDYFEKPESPIQVFFDTDINYRTLEPQLVKANGWERVNEIVDEKYKQNGKGYDKGDYKCGNENELLDFMSLNKTECALKFFDLADNFVVPDYILKAIEHAQKK